jgi:16S rRNA G966 N2-methylase RsmD
MYPPPLKKSQNGKNDPRHLKNEKEFISDIFWRMSITITQRSVGDLIPYARNSRTHSDEQVAQIAASIKEFGWTNPILVDSEGVVIAGHGRLMAARKLGYTEVPTIELSEMTETQKKAYVIADNRLALNAGWDNEMLTIELNELLADGYALDILGFDAKELDALLEPEVIEGLVDEDEVPEVGPEPVTKPGDIWLLGRHRLMCGDSTSIDAVDKLMAGEKVDMVYTDPPYGINIVKGSKVGGDKPFGSKDSRGTVGATNIVKANLYAPIAGDDTIDVALEAIQVIRTLGAKVEIIWGGNYYASALENSSCWIVWDKENTGNFADAELAWTNQKTAVRIFKHMWNGMVKASEHGKKRVHPTQKPVKLAEWCLDQYGENSKTVLDLFCGSGSTLIACENKGKTGYMMELSPHYCDVIVKRWEDFTGKKAVLEEQDELADA